MPTLYVSHTLEWHMGCKESFAFNSLYTTDIDESEFVRCYLMIFKTSSTGSLSKASKSLIYFPIGDGESFAI